MTAAAQQVHRLTEQSDAQLESQALAAVAAGPNAVEQLCQSWSRQLNTAANVSGGISKDGVIDMFVVPNEFLGLFKHIHSWLVV